MAVNLKTEVIVYIILILIVLSLCVKIKLPEDNFNCEECSILFKTRRPTQEDYYWINVSMIEIYESYLNDSCPIIWDRVSGYIGGFDLENER